MLDRKRREIKVLQPYPGSGSNPHKPQGSGLHEVIDLDESATDIMHVC